MERGHLHWLCCGERLGAGETLFAQVEVCLACTAGYREGHGVAEVTGKIARDLRATSGALAPAADCYWLCG